MLPCWLAARRPNRVTADAGVAHELHTRCVAAGCCCVSRRMACYLLKHVFCCCDPGLTLLGKGLVVELQI